MLEVNERDPNIIRTKLEKFDRSQILEVYFARADGRSSESISEELRELYEVELEDVKSFLLGQHPQDTILHKLFRIMQ